LSVLASTFNQGRALWNDPLGPASDNLVLILQSNFKSFILKESTEFNDSAIQDPDFYLDTDGIEFGFRHIETNKRF
jgi:hypothetical protein